MKYVYRLFDTKSRKYFEPKTNKVWLTPGAAKNAYNVRRFYFLGNDAPVFNKQSRFEVHTYSLTLKAVGL